MSIYDKTIAEYDDDITADVIEQLEKTTANKQYFWLVCAGKDWMCYVESGSVYSFLEYKNKTEYKKAIKQLAENLSIAY